MFENVYIYNVLYQYFYVYGIINKEYLKLWII